jgi:hypothetical protein
MNEQRSFRTIVARPTLKLFEFRRPTRAVPESSNVHATRPMIHAVNNAVGADNNFSDGRIAKFGNHAAHFGKLPKVFCTAHEEASKAEHDRENPLKCSEQSPADRGGQREIDLLDNP